MRGLALAVLVVAVSGPAVALAQAEPSDTVIGPAPVTGVTSAPPVPLQKYIAEANKNGYSAAIVGNPASDRIVLELTKIGKTQNGFGLLQRKWDEKDTINLTFARKDSGVTLQDAKRDVAIKPPIGDWIKQPSSSVPAWVLGPGAGSGGAT